MKISSGPVEPSGSISVTGTQAKQAPATPAVEVQLNQTQPKTEVSLETKIQTVLKEMGKLLEQQNGLLELVPFLFDSVAEHQGEVAKAVTQNVYATKADETLPNGVSVPTAAEDLMAQSAQPGAAPKTAIASAQPGPDFPAANPQQDGVANQANSEGKTGTEAKGKGSFANDTATSRPIAASTPETATPAGGKPQFAQETQPVAKTPNGGANSAPGNSPTEDASPGVNVKTGPTELTSVRRPTAEQPPLAGQTQQSTGQSAKSEMPIIGKGYDLSTNSGLSLECQTLPSEAASPRTVPAAGHGQQLADATTLTNGLKALIGSVKQSNETLSALAQKLDSTLAIRTLFPAEVPAAVIKTAEAAAASQTAKNNLLADLMAKVEQISKAPVPTPDGLASLRKECQTLLNSLGRDILPATAKQKLEQILPPEVRQFALDNKLPELKDAVAVLKLAEAREYLRLPTATLSHASVTLQDISTGMQKFSTLQTTANPDQLSLSMAFPLYWGDDKKAYPVYLHVSKDREDETGRVAGQPRDTWLRLCIMTENVGMVDLVFHLFGRDYLSVRATFGDRSYADMLRGELQSIRSQLSKTPFTLKDFTIATATPRNGQESW